MSDEKRRSSDDEAFKYKIVEQQAKIQEGIDGIKEDIRDQGRRIIDIESALWGYPKGDSIGLLEKHRKLAKNWAIAISVCAFVFSAVGRLISPLYDKWVADWAYNSPSEKWLRESQRPKVKVYKIYRKKETSEPSQQEAENDHAAPKAVP